MAGYNKKKIKQAQQPLQREINSAGKFIPKSIAQSEDPNKFYQRKPSWRFNMCDKAMWVLGGEKSSLFWNEILPQLKNWESNTWQYILGENNDLNHPIVVSKLNSVAKKRLETLHIEAESIYSLRLTGKHRLYGLIYNGEFNILWFDTDHGDNTTCVCRSHKSHT